MKRSRASQTNGMPSAKRQKTNPQPGRSQRTATSSSGARQASSFAAAAYASGQKTREPRVNGSGNSTRIRHRELVATVAGSAAFDVFQSIALNPGVAASFPWLSVQAASWEQYRFHKLCYEYITRAPTSATGSVLLAPDYDALDSAPATELQATSYRDATEDAPWKDQDCRLDPTAMFPMGPRKYIRSGLVTTSDLKTYDGGTLHVCTVGQANTDAIGKLWVEYDVELFVPQTGSGGGSSLSSFALFNLSANQALTTATVATVVFDEQVVNDLGIVNASGVFTLPAGNWRVHTECCAAGGTSSNTQCLLEVEKNNSAMAVPAQSFNRLDSVQNTGVCIPIECYVVSDGNDTVRVRITYTDPSGTIVATGDRCRISFMNV